MGKLQTSQYPVSRKGQNQSLRKTMKLVKTRSHIFLDLSTLLLRDFRKFVFNTSSGFLFAEFT